VPRRRSRATPRKSIFDPVHGPIPLDGVALALVGSPEFQRLWQIRQTGFAHLVFPGANHTRLEHSLGTFWVAGRMAERLGLGPEVAERVTAGALLHDLGHGPFSHTLDTPMVEVLGYGHETVSRAGIEGSGPAGSAATVPRILERYGLVPKEVADLIDPPPSGGGTPRLLREVLHGAVDADRIDYLQRDAHYTGVGHGAIDAARLLDTMRAIDRRLVFAEKGRSAVEGFLVGRALMYSTVYYHKTVRAAEMMAQAAVERSPGYPGDSGPLFRGTDGELLAELRRARRVTASLVDGLLDRRLYKRAFSIPVVPRSQRTRWLRWVEHPAERRAVEDRIAERLGGGPGTALLDLSGLVPRGDPSEDWGTVGLWNGHEVTYPFRESGPWAEFALRPPLDGQVTVFVAPRLRRPGAERRIESALDAA